MSPRTKRNLNTAMQSEAFTHALYSRFAANARMHQDWELARLLQMAADTDRTEHFAEEAELAGLVANDSENLRYAVEEKRAQAAMCARFAREAAIDGDLATAARFEKIGADEITQAEALEAACRIQISERTACLVEA